MYKHVQIPLQGQQLLVSDGSFNIHNIFPNTLSGLTLHYFKLCPIMIGFRVFSYLSLDLGNSVIRNIPGLW